jgi:hypothetical protein
MHLLLTVLVLPAYLLNPTWLNLKDGYEVDMHTADDENHL